MITWSEHLAPFGPESRRADAVCLVAPCTVTCEPLNLTFQRLRPVSANITLHIWVTACHTVCLAIQGCFAFVVWAGNRYPPSVGQWKALVERGWKSSNTPGWDILKGSSGGSICLCTPLSMISLSVLTTSGASRAAIRSAPSLPMPLNFLFFSRFWNKM